MSDPEHSSLSSLPAEPVEPTPGLRPGQGEDVYSHGLARPEPTPPIEAEVPQTVSQGTSVRSKGLPAGLAAIMVVVALVVVGLVVMAILRATM